MSQCHRQRSLRSRKGEAECTGKPQPRRGGIRQPRAQALGKAPTVSQIGISSQNISSLAVKYIQAQNTIDYATGSFGGWCHSVPDNAWLSRSSGFQQLRVPSSSDVTRTLNHAVIPNWAEGPMRNLLFAS